MHFFPPLCSIYLAYKGRGIVTSIQKAHLRPALSYKYFRHEVWIELDRHIVYESYFYNCTRFTDIYFAQPCMAQGHDFGEGVKIDSLRLRQFETLLCYFGSSCFFLIGDLRGKENVSVIKFLGLVLVGSPDLFTLL